MKLPIPKGLERRLRPHIERGERFLKDWEWTWTTAFLAGLILAFVSLILLAVVPSWWIYFADQTLQWRERFPWLVLRDIIATGWIGVWTGFFIVTFYKLQVIRRRLRGEKQAERYAGGYR